jgi:hypothetical protein
MRRLMAIGALVVAGCFSPNYSSGGLVCGEGTQPCPEGYHCALDHRCWKDGEDPDLANGSPGDLSTLGDMGDLAPQRPDFAGFDGGHVAKAITAACGGGVKAAGSMHSVTLSVGQKTSGVSVGTAHRVQLGVLRGTQAK